MIRNYGHYIASVSATLAAFERVSRLGFKQDENGHFTEFDMEFADSFLRALKTCVPNMKALHLDLSAMYAEEVISVWEGDGAGFGVVHSQHMISILEGRLHDELKSRSFMYVPSELADIYASTAPFGKLVLEHFPRYTLDIEEAGKCLALRRSTACVFHLMRVMEGGLKVTANALGIPYAPSWESYLKQIAKKVGDKHPHKGIEWKRDEPFFQDVAARLETVKFAWRNPTMHVVRSYTEEEAREVYDSVKVFMRHLATKLKDVPIGGGE